jgi:hypothetical protein
MVYSGVPVVKCASSAVAVLIKKKQCKNKILENQWTSSITAKFGLNFFKITFTIIGINVSAEGQNGEANGVYEELQETIEKNKYNIILHYKRRPECNLLTDVLLWKENKKQIGMDQHSQISVYLITLK